MYNSTRSYRKYDLEKFLTSHYRERSEVVTVTELHKKKWIVISVKDEERSWIEAIKKKLGLAHNIDVVRVALKKMFDELIH